MIDGHGDDIYRYGGRIRLNFSSNIYPAADLSELKAHLAARLDVIGTYPEPSASELESLIATRLGIGADCVMATAGATEAIYLVAQAMRTGEQPLSRFAVRRPTFCEYDDACRMFGYGEQREDDGLRGDVLRWICNPNNPTGSVMETDDIMKMTSTGGITVIDQSYEDYTLAPVLNAAEALQYPNVIQLHSMTKTYAVPGLRFGYVTARPELIARIRSCARPWAVNALAIEAGRWLLERDTAAIPDLRNYLNDAQELRRELNSVPGISVLPTETGFMLASMLRGTAADLKEWLAARHGMLIRDCSNITGLTPRHFRVAAGLPDDSRRLVEAVREYMLNESAKK